MKKKKMFFSWFLVVFLMFIIFYFSNQESSISSNTSTGLTERIFSFFNLDKIFIFDSFHGFIRKVAHFSIYFILGFLIYNAFFNTYHHRSEYIYLLIFTIFMVFIYSCSDEIHQLFIPGRSGEIRDVLIDTIGGSIGGLIYYFYLKIGCVRCDLQKR